MRKYKANRNRYTSVVKEYDILDDSVNYSKKTGFSNYRAAKHDSLQRERQMREYGDRGSFYDSYAYHNRDSFKTYKRKR